MEKRKATGGSSDEPLALRCKYFTDRGLRVQWQRTTSAPATNLSTSYASLGIHSRCWWWFTATESIDLGCLCTRRCVCPRRWTLAILGFGLLFFCTSIRDTLSVAIVCMVEDTNDVKYMNNNWTEANATSDITNDVIAVQEGVKFPWNKTEQSVILSMFFAGFFVSTFLGLMLLKHNIIRYYMGGSLMIISISSILLPFCMALEIRLIYPLRIIMGMSAATIFPGLQSMWGKWAPQSELTKLCTFTSSGRFVGTVFVFCLTGVLCDNVTDGWKVIFYICGGGGLVWFFMWQLLTSHNPKTDPFITKKERKFILANLAVSNKQRVPIPWKALLTSRPVWGCLICHMMCDWLDFSLTTNGPTYMNEVLHFNIAQNGVLSAVPVLGRALATPLVGQLGNILVKRKLLGIRAARITFQIAATVGSGACLVGLGFMSRDQRLLAVFLLACAFSFQAFSESAYQVNEVEIAPGYSGLISGMGNTLSGVSGILAPIVTGAMTPNKTQTEWRNNFLVVMGLTIAGTIIFLAFLDINVQPWAKIKKKHKSSISHVVRFGTEADDAAEVKSIDAVGAKGIGGVKNSAATGIKANDAVEVKSIDAAGVKGIGGVTKSAATGIKANDAVEVKSIDAVGVKGIGGVKNSAATGIKANDAVEVKSIDAAGVKGIGGVTKSAATGIKANDAVEVKSIDAVGVKGIGGVKESAAVGVNTDDAVEVKRKDAVEVRIKDAFSAKRSDIVGVKRSDVVGVKMGDAVGVKMGDAVGIKKQDAVGIKKQDAVGIKGQEAIKR